MNVIKVAFLFTIFVVTPTYLNCFVLFLPVASLLFFLFHWNFFTSSLSPQKNLIFFTFFFCLRVLEVFHWGSRNFMSSVDSFSTWQYNERAFHVDVLHHYMLLLHYLCFVPFWIMQITTWFSIKEIVDTQSWSLWN